MFSASSGGHTAPSLNGYAAVPDLGDGTAANPYHRWTASIPIARVESAWPAVGTLTGITVTRRNGLGEWGGRVQELQLLGTAGTVPVTGDQFRSTLGLQSDWFTVRPFGCLGNDAPLVTGDAVAAGPATFTPVSPVRLVDTRIGLGVPAAPLIGGCTIVVDPGLPDDATAAVVNITTVDTFAPGFVTPYPCGSPMPWVSTLQTVPGRIVAGSTVVPLGAGGRFCLFSPTATHVVVDLFGSYGTGGSGRYTPLAVAVRRFSSPVPRHANVPVQLAGGGGVPATGVEAVAVTVHATGAVEPGFVTVSGCESPRPLTSLLNVMPGQTVTNQAHVRVDGHGRVCLFASAPMTVTLEVGGWFGPAGAATFRPVPPARAMDTRVGLGNGGRLAPGENRSLPLWGRAGVPPGAIAVAATTSIVDAAGTGSGTVHACASPIPNVSMVRNLAPANSSTIVLGPVDGRGEWCLRAGRTPMDVLVDVVGWYGA